MDPQICLSLPLILAINVQGLVNSAWQAEAVAVAGGEGASWYLAVQGSDVLIRPIAIFLCRVEAWKDQRLKISC